MSTKKISELTAGVAAALTDLFEIVQGGANKKITLQLIQDKLAEAFQPLDAELTAIAGLASAADKLPYFTGSGTASLADLTAAGRALLDDAAATNQLTTLGLSANGKSLVTAADYAAMKALLDLEIGTDVQAQNARLADIAGATFAQGNIIYHNGTNLVVLAPGTSGHFLKTNGAAANPEWASSAGGSQTPWADNVDADGHDLSDVAHILAISALTPEAPAYSFAGDTDTGIYAIGADSLGVSVGNYTAASFTNAASVISVNLAVGTIAAEYDVMGIVYKLGFYGASPIAKQTGVGVDASSIHAALVNLGLITS